MRLGCLVVLFAFPAFAGPNPSLDKATRHFADLNYLEASKAIDSALKQPGNDRETLLKILELDAILLATLNQSSKSTHVFEQLLSLNPDFALTGNHPPRVTTAFFEARAWAAENGRLEARPLYALVEPGNVKAVRVEVTKDPAKLVKKVRFNIAGAQVVSLVVGGIASGAPKVPATDVSWWAQLLGDKDAVLADVGSAAWPTNEAAPPRPAQPEKPQPVANAAEKKDAPVVAPLPLPLPPPPLVKAQAPSTQPPAKRIAAYSLLGGAALFAGLGIGFGAAANSTRAQVDAAPTNSEGQVTNMSQRQALELDATQRVQATAANVFYISAAALAVAGGSLYFLSRSDGSVALVPAGPGVAVVGTFP